VTHAETAAPAHDLNWWVHRLGGTSPESGPPLFRNRSKVYRRRSLRLLLDAPEQLTGTPAYRDATPERRSALLLAATVGVLHRYAGAVEPQRIVVGHPGPDGVGTLPVGVDVSATGSFATLAEDAATALAESGRRAGGSTGLVEALGLDGVTHRHPLFSVLLRTADEQSEVPDLRHDVTVTLTPQGALELEYNSHLHEEGAVTRFGYHVQRFLALGLADPDAAARDIDYLTEEERSQAVRWSIGPDAPADQRCLHELVESAVQEHADREAVVHGDLTYTYAELDAKANQLAHHLRALGAGVGTRVGLCVPASPELLVGVLAILKSGAAAVPIVPTFPAARNRMVIADSAMELVLTHSSLASDLAGTGPALIEVDRSADGIAGHPRTAPETGATAEDLAYVLFTSGSTGRPKGVMMKHRTLVNLVRWQRERGLDPAGRRTLQRTSIGFDVSFQEIFSTWAFGGCLVVATDEVRDDVSILPEFIEAHGIARVFLPPVALEQMAVTANVSQRTLPTLREVVVAGEQLKISMPVRRLFHQMDCRLDNQYGPTETHVVTAHALTGASTRWPELPPIGRPVAGVHTYVLDPWLRPVPPGVPGEIHVGGLAPARGYLDPGATAERFCDDPFEPGGRLYRTGDRARQLADGSIEFLGRQDDQVKIRGYRIELGEVEANLLQLPGIRQAAATVHESEALGRQLTAHIVTDQEGQPEAARIRQLMLERVPDHMVPATSAILYTRELPTTPTGKVDRRALPPLPRTAAPASHTVAVGDTQQAVAGIWARALGLPQVSPDSGFMDLGGHSLIGIQVVAQLNELFSITLPLRSLLRGSTVAALAKEIDTLRAARSGAPAPAEEAPTVLPEPRTLELPGGRTLVCLHPAETRYLHLDVFEHRTYDRGGIQYPDSGLVLDVGAHIGLFTLYALERSPGLEVHAFEPCPPLFEVLRRNTEHLPQVRRFPFGLGAVADAAELTFYPNLTGMSSFHPDAGQERELLAGIIKNLSTLPEQGAGALLAESDEYLAERLQAMAFRAERRPLSEVLAQTGAERVALLKIDVQKSEPEVLDGIAPEDWPKIDQVAVELHDLDGRLEQITGQLTAKGFQVTVEQDVLHAGTAVHFAYAVRP